MKKQPTWGEILEWMAGAFLAMWFLSEHQPAAAMLCIILGVLVDRMPKTEKS